MQNKLPLSRSIVSYDTLSNIPEEFDLSNDDFLFFLKEDLLQIQCSPINVILDVGWYPEFEADGQFRISIIQNENWESPLEEKTARDMAQLRKTLKDIIEKYNL